LFSETYKKSAEIYHEAAYEKCMKISNGREVFSAARVGAINNFRCVDERGIVYHKNTDGNYEPCSIVFPVFKNIPTDGFNKTYNILVEYQTKENKDGSTDIIDENVTIAKVKKGRNGYQIKGCLHPYKASLNRSGIKVVKEINAYPFDDEIKVGKDGRLYLTHIEEDVGPVGIPKGLSYFTSSLELEAYKAAKLGYDPSLLEIAKKHAEECKRLSNI